jgi:hypothetical protein
MEVSGQLHASAALPPGKEPTVLIGVLRIIFGPKREEVLYITGSREVRGERKPVIRYSDDDDDKKVKVIPVL